VMNGGGGGGHGGTAPEGADAAGEAVRHLGELRLCPQRKRPK